MVTPSTRPTGPALDRALRAITTPAAGLALLADMIGWSEFHVLPEPERSHGLRAAWERGAMPLSDREQLLRWALRLVKVWHRAVTDPPTNAKTLQAEQAAWADPRFIPAMLTLSPRGDVMRNGSDREKEAYACWNHTLGGTLRVAAGAWKEFGLVDSAGLERAMDGRIPIYHLASHWAYPIAHPSSTPAIRETVMAQAVAHGRRYGWEMMTYPGILACPTARSLLRTADLETHHMTPQLVQYSPPAEYAELVTMLSTARQYHGLGRVLSMGSTEQLAALRPTPSALAHWLTMIPARHRTTLMTSLHSLALAPESPRARR